MWVNDIDQGYKRCFLLRIIFDPLVININSRYINSHQQSENSHSEDLSVCT